MFFSVTAPDGTEVFPIHDNGDEACWAMGKEGILKHINAGTLIWKKRIRLGESVWTPYTREFAPANPSRPYPSIWNDLDTMRQAKAMLRSIFETANQFDTPKPVNLIERILRMINDSSAIILDSFAGSGTTAHAVINMNKADGGNRKFILVEMMDYADSITAERVKRVINGYGEGKNAVEGTGGDFTFYDLGQALLLPDGNLNEEVDTDKIREYIWYTETKTSFAPPDTDNPYYLGKSNDTGYYFYYEKERLTTLNHEYLATIAEKAECYLIYADLCTIPDEELKKYNITFKKIPRDIAKL